MIGFARQKEIIMRKLLVGSAAVAAAMLATPAAAQIYVGVGQSPYAYGYSQYGYGYSPYSYGYRPYSYGYSYPRYGYGYSYPSYGYSYPSYGYPYRSYGHRSSYNCLRRHHRNGVVYYTRVC
jgi:hypothetical protein